MFDLFMCDLFFLMWGCCHLKINSSRIYKIHT